MREGYAIHDGAERYYMTFQSGRLGAHFYPALHVGYSLPTTNQQRLFLPFRLSERIFNPQ